MSLAPLTATPVGAALAGPAAQAAPSPQPAAAAVPTPPTATPAQAPLASLLTDAAARQDGLAPLLASLAVAAQSEALPAAAQSAIASLLGALAPLDADVTGQALRAAALNSGLFLEAELAAQAQGEAAAPDVSQDLKSLLGRLIAALQAEDPAETTPAPSASRPPPPLAGGQITGQAPARPTFDRQAPPEVMLRALRQQAESALARVELGQAASAPKPGEPTRWNFEAPVATPGGTGVAQFELSRDGRGPGGQAAEAPTWRARFAINAAPGGTVRAALTLSDGRLRVTLLAEDDGARAALAAGQDELLRTLADTAEDVAVRVIGGAPEPAAPPPGQFLDRRS